MQTARDYLIRSGSLKEMDYCLNQRIKRNGLLSELEIEDITRKLTETPNDKAQVRENTKKEPVGSETIELVQHKARTDQLDEEEEVKEQSEKQNIIYEKLESEFRKN